MQNTVLLCAHYKPEGEDFNISVSHFNMGENQAPILIHEVKTDVFVLEIPSVKKQAQSILQEVPLWKPHQNNHFQMEVLGHQHPIYEIFLLDNL